MEWTQVHVSGINPDLQLSDDALETKLNELFHLSDTTDWAGEGTSIFKRVPIDTDNDNSSNTSNRRLRGYGFLSFLSVTGATTAIQNMNGTECLLGKLVAEFSQVKKNKKNRDSNGECNDARDVRLRRKRAPPSAKHPVKTSSNVAKLYRG